MNSVTANDGIYKPASVGVTYATRVRHLCQLPNIAFACIPCVRGLGQYEYEVVETGDPRSRTKNLVSHKRIVRVYTAWLLCVPLIREKFPKISWS